MHVLVHVHVLERAACARVLHVHVADKHARGPHTAPPPGQAALSSRRASSWRLVRVAPCKTEPPNTCQHSPSPACLQLHARPWHTTPSQAPDQRWRWPSGATRRADARQRGARAAGTRCRRRASRPQSRGASLSVDRRSSSEAPHSAPLVPRSGRKKGPSRPRRLLLFSASTLLS